MQLKHYAKGHLIINGHLAEEMTRFHLFTDVNRPSDCNLMLSFEQVVPEENAQDFILLEKGQEIRVDIVIGKDKIFIPLKAKLEQHFEIKDELNKALEIKYILNILEEKEDDA